MQKRKWYHVFWFSFLRSNYITAIWNWFLGLAGKAAEAVLTASVVYSCARLLPAVHTSPEWDNSVFIAQMVALDIGGLSLRKLANQAKKDGNTDGATLASRVSIALISIMIANVALSVVQSITPISAQAVGIVEGLLLIARAVMAVIYAHVIHSLRVDIDQQPTPPALQSGQIDPWPMVVSFAQLQADFEQRLVELASTQKTALAELSNKLNDASQQIDFDAVTQEIMARLRAEFDARQKAQIEVIEERMTHQIDAPKTRQKRVSAPKNDASKKILSMRQPSASITDKKEAIHRLLEKNEDISNYQLGALVGCSESTARRIKNEWIDAMRTGQNDASEPVILTHDAQRLDA